MWHISKGASSFPLVPFLASGMSRMTEYIAIEDDNVMTHFLQVFVIGMEDFSECWYWAIQVDECLVIHMTH